MAVTISPDGSIDPRYENIVGNVNKKKNLEKLQQKYKERFKEDKKKLKAFKQDKANQSFFNANYERVDIYNNGVYTYVPCQFFLTYPDKKGLLEGLGEFNLTAEQESNLVLYPIVKSLINGKLYVVSDSLCYSEVNPEYLDWMEKADKSTRFAETVPKPIEKVFNADIVLGNRRFFLNKFSANKNIENHYIFLFDRDSLKIEYKGI